MKAKKYYIAIIVCLLTVFTTRVVAQPPCLQRGFASNITHNSAVLNFPGHSNPPCGIVIQNWNIQYGEQHEYNWTLGGKIMSDGGPGYNLNTVLLSNLKPNTRYIAEVTLFYIDQQGYNSISPPYRIRFTTPQIAANIPFDAAAEYSKTGLWTMDAPSITGTEHVGLKMDMKAGIMSAYFDNEYKGTTSSTIAYEIESRRTLNFSTVGKHTITFDWSFFKTIADGSGSSIPNFFRVFLAPRSQSYIDPQTEVTALRVYKDGSVYNKSNGGLPNGCIALDEGLISYNQLSNSAIHNYSLEFTIPQTGEYDLYVYYSGPYVFNGALPTLYSPNATESSPLKISNLYVDRACSAPANLSAQAVTSASATLTWNETGTATQWEIEYGPAGFTPGTGTSVTVSAKSTTINGLTQNTQYDAYVRALCGGSDKSAWSVKTSFGYYTCPAPTAPQISNIGYTSADVRWTENGTAAQWEIQYGVPGFTPGTGTIVTTTANPTAITGLTPNTHYQAYIRAVCSGGESVWSPYTSFTTAKTIASLPYRNNFEDDAENVQWTLANGTETNTWWIGTAANNTPEGSKSLYISNNNGTNNAYTGSGTNVESYVYASRIINFAASGKFNISFDWKSSGENYYDVLRAFLVPTTATLTGGVANEMTGNKNTPPSGWIALDGGSPLYAYSSWQTKTTTFNVPAAGNYELVFFWKNDNSTSSNPPAAVDNILITSCLPTTALTASNIATESATLSWTENGTATQWEIQYGAAGFALGSGSFKDVNTSTTTLSNLSPATGYDVYVRAVCSGTDKSLWSPKTTFTTFSIPQTPAALPYETDFENDGENNKWTLANGAQTNIWHFGTAANNTAEGAKSLYISNDGGVSNAYTINIASPNSATSYSYAYRTINFAATGEYDIYFDWKANGESGSDYLRVFLVPESVNIIAGNTSGVGGSGWIALDGGAQLRGVTTWQTKMTNFAISTAGNYNLVFFWRNDNGSGTNPPAAVDNIKVKKTSCLVPTALKTSNVTHNSVGVEWTEKGTATQWEIQYGATGFALGNGTIENASATTTTLSNLNQNTNYDLYVRAVCSGTDQSAWSSKTTFTTLIAPQIPATLPYETDFENDGENNKWTLANGTQPNKWYFGTAANNTAEGAKSLYISNNNGTSNAYSSTSTSYTYAYRTINFAETGEHNIAFDWRAYGEDMNDVLRAFLVPASVTTLTAGNANGMTYNYNSPPSGWIALDGGALSSSSTWQTKTTIFTVSTAGNYNLVFFWKNNDNMIFSYPPAAVDNVIITKCLMPASVTSSNPTTNGATVSWTAKGAATQWEIQYGATGFAPGSGTIESVSATTATLSNLNPATAYDVYVRAVCSGTDQSLWSSKITFTTLAIPQTPAALPYETDFENDEENNKWTLSNGTQTNKWYFGTAANNTEEGAKSLYISNNNGTSNAYTITSTSYVYAYRTINFAETGEHDISFDWKADGEGNYDLLRAFLVPASVTTLAAGNANGMTGNSNTTPSDWIALDGGKLNGSSVWQTKTTTLTIPTAGNYNLVFFWKNDNRDGTNPPAAVDNITISKNPKGPASIPYQNNFENNTENSQWEFANGTQTNKWVIGTAANNTQSGTKSLYISNDNGVNNAYSNTSQSYTYAYRTINFAEASDYAISFDWRADGEDDYDLPRAFLVPASVTTLTAGNANGMTGSSNTTPSGWIALDGGILSGSSAWQTKITAFTIPTAGNYNLVFFWKNDNMIGTNPPAAVDNITITKCLPPVSITLSNLTAESATLSWTAKGGATQWEIEYGVAGFVLGSGTITSASATTTTLSNLSPTTNYDVYVRAVCSATEKSAWSSKTTFTTLVAPQTPATLPYITDFENAEENNKWTLENGTQTNKWVIGTAANNTQSGTKSLYISNNSGTNNAYSNTSTSHTYAYRTINFVEASDYAISFDWRADGEDSYDLLRAFLVPASVTLAAGNANGMTNSTNTTPSGWIALDGGILSGSSAWQTKTTAFTVPTAGNYNLVFFWKNDNMYGTNPPAAVDNIDIKKISCPAPTALKTSTITHNSTGIEWTENGAATQWEIQYGAAGFALGSGTIESASATTTTLSNLTMVTYYDVYVRAVCSATDKSAWSSKITFTTLVAPQTPAALPYKTDFENDEENNKWTLENGMQTNKWHFGTAANNTQSGAKSLYISNNSGVSNAYSTNSESYVYAYRTINFPASEYTISFDWRAYSENTYDLLRAFLVPESVTTLTAGNANGMTDKNNTMPSGWIALDGGVLSGYSTWQTKTTTFTVPTAGNYNLVFFWKNDNSNGYMPPAAVDNIDIKRISCPAPAALKTSTITHNSVNVEWTEKGDATQWEIEYGTAGFALGNGTIENANAATKTLSSLNPSTAYDVYVRAVCSATEKSAWSSKTTFTTFATPQTPAALPYKTDFENDEENNKWTLENGTQTNKWLFGTAANNTAEGAKSLYISDNGKDNSYSTASSSRVYAYRTINFAETGEYDISFDWKTVGESFFNTDYDYLRVFLVPENVIIIAGNLNGITSSSTPSGWIALDGGKLNNYSVWQTKTKNFSVTTAGNYNLVFFWENDNSGGIDPPAAIDNIMITNCLPPVSVTSSNVTPESATLSWTAKSGATQWEIEYGTAGFALGSGTIENANATTKTLSNLNPLTDYDVYMRAVCSATDKSAWSSKITFTTLAAPQTPAALPYETDFENDGENNKWTLLNGAQTNKWHFGTAANNTAAGAKSLYISDNGKDNSYSTTSESIVYAYRTINFAATGKYDISFDWRANGEKYYDYLRVFLVPVSVNIFAGTTNEITSSLTPSGWIALDGGGQLYGVSTWQTKTTNFSVTTAGNYNLVFFWVNDTYGGSYPPAAVDNISISALECVHVFDEWQITKAATCAVEGERTEKCSICGTIGTKKEVIAKTTNHNFSDWQITKAATCAVEGERIEKCSICGTIGTKKEAIAKTTNHIFSDWQITKTATCAEEGERIEKCSICGTIGTKKEAIAKTEAHSFGILIVITVPTCAEEGYKAKVCSICGEESDVEAIAKLGHNFEWTETTAATCDAAGEETQICSLCEEKGATRSIDRKTEGCECKHTFSSWEVSKLATCAELGEETRICSLCDKVENQPIVKLEHNFNDWQITKAATCAEEGEKTEKCSICGTLGSKKEAIAKTDTHSFGILTVITVPTCEEEGYKAKVCSICGKESDVEAIAKLGHDFANYTSDKNATCTADGTETGTCSRCAKTDTRTVIGSQLAHNYVWKLNPENKDEEIFVCTLCGDVADKRDVQCAHVFSDWQITKVATCAAAGEKIEKCSICGTLGSKKEAIAKTEAHSFGILTVITVPTCAEEGYKAKVCSICGKESDVEAIAKLGHNFEWTETTAATCDAAGEETQICSLCEEKGATRSIDRKTEGCECKHTFSSWEVSKPATCAELGEETRICSICSEIDTRSIPKQEHIFEWKIAVKASCEKAGVESEVCTLCAVVNNTKPIAKLEHDFSNWETTKEPTCGAAGEQTEQCALCGEFGENTKAIPPTGKHTYIWIPNPDKANEELEICSLCGEESGNTRRVTAVETLQATSVQVYPNPTKGQLTISMNNEQLTMNNRSVAELGEANVVEIYDNAGRLVETWRAASLHGNGLTIDISHLANGIYFIQINGKRVTVVKQ